LLGNIGNTHRRWSRRFWMLMCHETAAMGGTLMITLLHIYRYACLWQNFENQSQNNVGGGSD